MIKSVVPKILYFLRLVIFLSRIILIFINFIIILEWNISKIFGVYVRIELILEWRGILYSSAVLFISGSVILFSKEYMIIDYNNTRFTIIVLLFIISINILILIPNIICLLIGWDGLGATSFILIIYYNNSRSLRAGILTIIVNRLGDVFLLISIRIILNNGSWLPIYYLVDNRLCSYQWIGILIAAMTKSAQIPYSSWLPAAIAAPTPVSALVHSSTLVTAGIFILYRFNLIINNSKVIQSIILICGILTIIVAGISAIYEIDIKKVIALSTLSQLGLIVIPLSIKIPILRFFHMLTHAIFKALLFIASGVFISQSNHNQDLRLYGVSYNFIPVTSSAILISSLALIGIPFIRGYYSKHAIILWSSLAFINVFIYIILFFIILLTSFYSFRIIIFIIILPVKKYPIMQQKRSIDSNGSLIVISIVSTIVGRIIQWFSPLVEVIILTEEKIKRTIINFIILLRIISLIGLIIKFKYIKYAIINKLFRSIIFIIPISTQSILSYFINISLLLYKYLDQFWLEKLFRFGPSKNLLELGFYIDNTFLRSPQSSLSNRVIISISILFIVTIFYW